MCLRDTGCGGKLAAEPRMDRWQTIENAYQVARDLHGEDRARFLAGRCGSDVALQKQVEALLAQDDVRGSIIDRAALDVVAELAFVGDATILTGRRLGSYQLGELIGSGGMGQVYRARDTSLDRQVALKVLPAAFALDADRLARFTREAQVLGALNHPHIATLYGLHEADGLRALVLELVDGSTLADRIGRGAIPVDEAVAIARQIAAAIEAAHEVGVVHRDLKPANIKIRPDGTVKVLDFGLAKTIDTAWRETGQQSSASSPGETRVGMLLGTAAYMSPEQAKGSPADRRSDVWAFGCVLYEMLTGRRAFRGEDVGETLASVLRDAPDWTAWPTEVPPSIRALVEACLQKEPKQRIAHIAAAQFVLSERRAMAAWPPETARRQSRWKSAALVGSAAVIAGFIGWIARPSVTHVGSGVTRFAIPLANDQQLRSAASLAISPEGRQVIYVADHRLYLRSMSDREARPIPGTDSAQTLSPVFSPDGRSVVFWSGTDQALKKVPVGGGKAMTVCPAGYPMGISWDEDGLLFGQLERGIMRVSADGGTPEVIVEVKSGEAAYSPQRLPGGRGTLLTIASTSLLDKPRLVVQTATERKTLMEDAADGRYLPTGHIVYAVQGTLFAVRFDVRRLEVTSAAVPVLEGVARTTLTTTGSFTGFALWVVSNNGSLVYVPASSSPASVSYNLAILDRKGATELLKLPAAAYQSPRVSPDGRQLAFGLQEGNRSDVWTYDLSGTTTARRVTFAGNNRFPVWSPDSQTLAFQSDRDGDVAVFRQPADSSAGVERLTKPDLGMSHIPESWSRNGMLSISVGNGSRYALWIMSLQDRQVMRFGDVESEIPIASAFSPDGHWVAYQTFQPVTSFVQPFPPTGARFQIPGSTLGPVWSRNGQELLYAMGPPPVKWMRTSVSVHPTLSMRSPVPVQVGPLQTWFPDWWRHYDMARDGRIVGLIPANPSVGAGATRSLEVVQNWFEELEGRVAAK